MTFAQLSLKKRVLGYAETKGRVRLMSRDGEFGLAFGARLALAVQMLQMDAKERGVSYLTVHDLAAAAEKWTISEGCGMWDDESDASDYHGLIGALEHIMGEVVVDAGDDR